MAFVSFIETLSAGTRTYFGPFEPRRVQIACAVLVVIFHAFAIWIISLNIAPVISPPRMGELHVALASEPPQAKPEEPPPVELAAVMLQPPEIVIESEADTAPNGVVSPADVLAPRPDPSHPNEPPSGAIIRGNASKLPPISLNLLVKEDGSVAAAKVVKSCGDGSIDDRVIAYVRANWRFLPALVREKTAIQYWMTVSVQLSI